MLPKKSAAYYKRQKDKESKKRQKEADMIQAEHDAVTDESKKKKDIEFKAVSALLKNIQRNMVTVVGNGDCLFSALFHQLKLHGSALGASVSSIAEIRAYLSSHMLTHKNDYNQFLPRMTEEDEKNTKYFEDYCDRIANTKEWGSMMEVKAAQKCFGNRIVVVTMNGLIIFGPRQNLLSVNPEDWVIVHLQHQYALGEHFNATTKDKTVEAITLIEHVSDSHE